MVGSSAFVCKVRPVARWCRHAGALPPGSRLEVVPAELSERGLHCLAARRDRGAESNHGPAPPGAGRRWTSATPVGGQRRLVSRYQVSSRNVGSVVHVGWLPDDPEGGYWYAVFEGESEEVIIEGGIDDHLTTLVDLLRETWSLVSWPDELPVLRMLRDDPWVEHLTAEPGSPGVHELLVEAFCAPYAQ